MLSLTALTADNIAQAAEYWEKKRMSSAIFHYFIHADIDQKMEVQVEIWPSAAHVHPAAKQPRLPTFHLSSSTTKFDDLGYSLFHALDEILWQL